MAGAFVLCLQYQQKAQHRSWNIRVLLRVRFFFFDQCVTVRR